ncbi:MAG: hypothetical protein QM831_22205 [Kofleriaceae bacterium]
MKELDQKLWVALAMPVNGTAIDATTLGLLDLDTDGRIRANDILEAVDWTKATFKNPGDLLTTRESVELSALADQKVVAAARRVLSDLGKPTATSFSVADTVAIDKAFANTVLNGDGIVIPPSTPDEELRKVIEDVSCTVGTVMDRSGKPGIDKDLAAKFFADVDQRYAWLARSSDPTLSPLGERTESAFQAFQAVEEKLDDYFTRCRIAAFDPRAQAALAGAETELVTLASHALRETDTQLALLPLARVDAAGQLLLKGALNPAWHTKVATFVEHTVTPLLGVRETLTETDVVAIRRRLEPYRTWFTAKPTTTVDGLDRTWLDKLASPSLRRMLDELIASDAALADDYAQIGTVTKAARMQRDFGRVLRNFVNFSDFYTHQDGVFQSGTLYFDARALRLCVPVTDAAKHGALAASSDACLIYCDLSRKGETKQIAAAVTNGDADNIFVGRNGVFYDREGRDWDATVAKIVSNPISVRAAFWSPYKKLVKTVEDAVQKRAQAAEAASNAKMEGAGRQLAEGDKIGEAATKPDPTKPEPEKKLDLGTVAAIGVAIGGISTLFGALLALLFGLGPWLPLGMLGILLMISGPSMLLAWLKLRRRNLGPILDANGWAINGRARINVAFGAAMTEMPKLPAKAKRSLDDPFADKKTPWKRWALLVVILLLVGLWYIGKLDRWLPTSATSVDVLGSSAPAYKAQKADQK